VDSPTPLATPTPIEGIGDEPARHFRKEQVEKRGIAFIWHPDHCSGVRARNRSDDVTRKAARHRHRIVRLLLRTKCR
jgi:hypothetical protein